jgi:hypothetical protein
VVFDERVNLAENRMLKTRSVRLIGAHQKNQVIATGTPSLLERATAIIS